MLLPINSHGTSRPRLHCIVSTRVKKLKVHVKIAFLPADACVMTEKDKKASSILLWLQEQECVHKSNND